MIEPGSIIISAQLRDAIVTAIANAVHPGLSYAQVQNILREIGKCKPVELEPARPQVVEGAAE